MSNQSVFFQGLRTSWPLIIGYLPVAIAFGISAQGLELNTVVILLISILIFAGASQFALLSLVAAGTPMLTIVLITVGLNLRHLLYSSNLSSFFERSSLKQRLLVAFGLTDEVFAAAFLKIKQIPVKQRWIWIIGLEFGAYLSWILGTFLGIKGSHFLLDQFAQIKPVLDFALPALFFSLLLPLFNKNTIFVILTAFVTALIFVALDYSNLGIFVAAFISPLLYILISSNSQENR